MSAPVRGRVGALSLEEVRELRAAETPSVAIAERAHVTASRMKSVLRDLGLSYAPGGARANAGRKPLHRRDQGSRW